MVEVGLYQDLESFFGLWQTCVNTYDYGCPTETCVNVGSDVAGNWTSINDVSRLSHLYS